MATVSDWWTCVREKKLYLFGQLRSTRKMTTDLGKDRYAGCVAVTKIATHATQLRSGLRSGNFRRLTCEDLDQLDDCYAATQKEIYIHARELHRVSVTQRRETP
jgi:hypothetical protein